jgi:outer membrane lipoprotein carrier protein
MWSLFAILLTVSQPATVQPAVAKAPTALKADEVVTKVQKYYNDIKLLMADFRQEYENVTFGKKSQSDGNLYLAKPCKMRWDYVKPETKYFISDGKTLWIYEKDNKQAYKKDLKNEVLPAAVSFLCGEGKLADEFDATLDPGKYGGKGDLVLKLTPKQPSAQYKNLWLVIDSSDFHVKESVILEASNNINHFTFANIKLNEKAKKGKKTLGDWLFTFDPTSVPGLKVIEPAAETGTDTKTKTKPETK